MKIDDLANLKFQCGYCKNQSKFTATIYVNFTSRGIAESFHGVWPKNSSRGKHQYTCDGICNACEKDGLGHVFHMGCQK